MADKNAFSSNIPLPPPLHTRRANDMYDRPTTPRANAFFSPQATPTGSPSKFHPPPGAYDLPGVFDNALKLAPTVGSPSRIGRPAAHSPTKTGFDEYPTEAPGTPTRKANKENTPPSRPGAQQKDSYMTQAAASRQQPYNRPPARAESIGKNVQRGLSPEDIEKLQKPSVKRLANVTQLCKLKRPLERTAMLTASDFLDHYYDLLSYVHNRQNRLAQFKAQYPPPPDTPEEEYNAALHKYLGRERANLRKRRTRLRHGDFQILTQVGQGGYGQVYLAQKKDTREVCALKVMSKKLLFKLDEVRHVLTERDILTNAKSEWLVRLLYAFQDDRSIYLAMVCQCLLLRVQLY